MKHFLYLAAIGIIAFFSACSHTGSKQQETISNERESALKTLGDSLHAITEKYPGEIGIAILTDTGDTITTNNAGKYPLMSVFKLHQAISLCHLFEENDISLDSIVNINRDQLNPDTWSPMLKDYSQNTISISVRDLLRYTLMQSDNNASNYLFENIESVNDADKFIATLIPRDSFKLKVTEAQMWDNHALCYENYSSPLGAALLINRLFTDRIIGKGNRDFICTTLKECKTGMDRIVAPLKDKTGVTIAHKTGSGFKDDNGVLSAHNDVGFIELHDDRHYTLAVLVKDFKENETEAAKSIADISATVYSILTDKIYR